VRPALLKPKVAAVEAHASAPPKAAVEAAGAGVCEGFRPLVAKYDWNVDIAMAVMKAESGCNSKNFNYNTDGTNDAGLFQNNSIHDATDRRYDPEYNVALAYRIYKDRRSWDISGWRAWTSCWDGKVKCY
jgi:hypothetical protein